MLPQPQVLRDEDWPQLVLLKYYAATLSKRRNDAELFADTQRRFGKLKTWQVVSFFVFCCQSPFIPIWRVGLSYFCYMSSAFQRWSRSTYFILSQMGGGGGWWSSCCKGVRETAFQIPELWVQIASDTGLSLLGSALYLDNIERNNSSRMLKIEPGAIEWEAQILPTSYDPQAKILY